MSWVDAHPALGVVLILAGVIALTTGAGLLVAIGAVCVGAGFALLR